MKALNPSLNKFQKRNAQELQDKQLYDKTFNLLIHGIEENNERLLQHTTTKTA